MGMESCSSSSLISACYPRVSGQPFVPFVHGNRAREGVPYAPLPPLSAVSLRFWSGRGVVGRCYRQAAAVGRASSIRLIDDRVQVQGGHEFGTSTSKRVVIPSLSAMTQATGHRQTKRIQRGSAASRSPLVDASSVTGPEPQRVHEPSPAVRAGCRTRGCDGGLGCRIFCPSIPRCHFKPWFKNRYLPGLPKACCAGSSQVQASGCRPLRPSPSNRDDDIWGCGRDVIAGLAAQGPGLLNRTQKSEG